MSKGVLLDTNLLTVYLIGALGWGEVEQFKRTRQFTSEDVVILDTLLKSFRQVYTTPHIIAEVSNLLDWMKHEAKQQRLKSLLAQYVQSSNELNIPAKQIVLTPIYLKLGITDAALFQLAKDNDLTLITIDLGLYGYASKYKVTTINFNHMRNL